MQTEATEMYLITVYRLTRQAPYASTKEIATMLGVSQPSVTERIKRLGEQGYLNYEWREGTTLTAKGERIAINVLRKHRLLETFLVEMAGYSLDEIHAEACKIEHAISDRLANRLEAMLGSPKVDPHGHPIPTEEGDVATLDNQSLADVLPGEAVIVSQVSDWDHEQLRYVQELGLVPGVEVVVVDKAPFDGPVTLELGEKTIAIAQTIAQEINVSRS